MSDVLLVLLSGNVAGRVERRGEDGRLLFEYDADYAVLPRAVPLSLSMPRDERSFGDARVAGWMSSLLPGHPDVRADWARRYEAASPQPFDLLGTRVGLECAGAVQFCKPETLDAALSGSSDTTWCSAARIEEMVADMVREVTLWGHRLGRSAFSLAGAHAKVALYRDEARPHRWAETRGASPTTHILKPPLPGDAEQSINEHLCLTAARHAGLVAAETELQTWGEHTVLVVKRFDRVRGDDDTVRRVHQEDLYQAKGDYTADIYQGEGGRGHDPGDIAELFTAHASDPRGDGRAFFDALALNWLICNTDAHSKNYSFLIGPDRVRLAPLYDIWSILPGDPKYYGSSTLAMSALSDRRILAANNRSAWEMTAAAVGVDPDEGLDRVERLVRTLPTAISRAIDELDDSYRKAATVSAFASLFRERSTSCLAALTQRSDGPLGLGEPKSGTAAGSDSAKRKKRPAKKHRTGKTCRAWMPIARTHCILPEGHRGNHRSRRPQVEVQ